MDTNDIQRELQSEGEVEVLVGLNQDMDSDAKKLDLYMGDDGDVLKSVGFDILRVRMTSELLEELVQTEPVWIDYIEGTELTS
jgi:hypothetical protein